MKKEKHAISIAEVSKKIKGVTPADGDGRLSCLVFDFGQVLVHFDPRYLVAPYAEGADRELVAEVLFDRGYWDRLDAGDIADDEVIRQACARLPQRLHEACRRAYLDWPYRLPEIEGMRALLIEIRATGLPIYVLSNISRYFAAHTDGAPILSLTDGHIFSAEVGCVKPSPAIFERLRRAFSLTPGTTLFVDDSAANVAGARSAGYQAYQFDGSAAHLRRELVRLGVLDRS